METTVWGGGVSRKQLNPSAPGNSNTDENITSLIGAGKQCVHAYSRRDTIYIMFRRRRKNWNPYTFLYIFNKVDPLFTPFFAEIFLCSCLLAKISSKSVKNNVKTCIVHRQTDRQTDTRTIRQMCNHRIFPSDVDIWHVFTGDHFRLGRDPKANYGDYRGQNFHTPNALPVAYLLCIYYAQNAAQNTHIIIA